MSDGVDFCWVCGSDKPFGYNNGLRKKYWSLTWRFSDGAFAYGVCWNCVPTFAVAWPMVFAQSYTEWVVETATLTRSSCGVCGAEEYEGRSLHNHSRSLTMSVRYAFDGPLMPVPREVLGPAISAGYMLCPACRPVLDDVRAAARTVLELPAWGSPT